MARRSLFALLICPALAVQSHAYAEEKHNESSPAPVVNPDSDGDLGLPVDAIVPSDPFGYLGGDSQVTQSGDFAWHLSLWTPPTRDAALSPGLAINYSARSGNGLLGVGFELGGLPELRRCASTIATDSGVKGATFDVGDQLCIAGNRLILVTGAQGQDGSEYRAERDGFDRIVFHKGGLATPSTFEVFGKDGRIITYSSLKVFRADVEPTWPYATQPAAFVDALWVISEVKDRAGGRAVYHWKTLPSPELFSLEYLPDKIEYTLRAGDASGKRSVQFVYEDRPDPSFAFASGVRFQTTKRLKAIELHAPDPTLPGLVGRYEFTYLNSPTTLRSLLHTISRCDGEGACLWAKEFQWETSPRPEFNGVDLDLIEYPDDALNFAPGDTGFLVLDTDGDAKDEILYRINFDFYIRRMDSSGTPLGERIWIDPALAAPSPGAPGFENIILRESRAVDVDGDGALELWAAQVVQPEPQFHIFTWSAGSAQPVSAGAFPAQWAGAGNSQYPTAIHFGDVNGDARPDLLSQRYGVDGIPRWRLYKNDSGVLAAPFENSVKAHCGHAARILDEDGDGRAELWTATDFGCTESATMAIGDDSVAVASPKPGLGFEAKRAVLADLNGDGLRDLVRPGPWYLAEGWVRWNTGRGFGPKEPLVDGPHIDGNTNAGMDQGTHVLDLNNDGREDILAFRYDPWPSIFAYISRGDGSFVPLDLSEWPGFFQMAEGFTTSRPGDFNGDGLIDIVTVTPDGNLRVLTQKPGQVDVVTAIGDLGSEQPRDVIHYSNQWSDAPEPASCTFPQRCIRHGLPVVREHWSWQGSDVNQYQKLLYDYQDPRMDLQGRGFLGFGEVRVRDADRLSETRLTFDHATRLGSTYPYAGLPALTVHVAPILTDPPPSLPATVRARVTRSEHQYGLELFPFQHTHFVHPWEWASDEWEQEVIVKPDGIDVPYDAPAIVRHREGMFEYDDYGNQTKVEVVTQGGVRRTLETAYDIRPDVWLISLPQATSYLAADANAQHTPEPRVVHYVHDALGLLESVKVEPFALDPSEQLTTTFERNADGLVTLITWEAPAEAPRHLSIAYDADEGIFPTKVWNNLGFAEAFAFYPAYGFLSASRDINGVDTRRYYDAFGRLRRVETDGEAGVDIELGVSVKGGWVRGLIEHVTSDAGSASYTVFDELNRPVEEATTAFNGPWSRVATTYDHLGRTKSVTRPELGAISPNKTTYSHDTLDRLVKMQAPDGSITEHSYDLFSATTKPPQKEESTLVFDVDGRVVKSVDRLNGQEVTTSYVYRAFDQVRFVIDAEQNITSITYDKRGRRSSIVDPDRGLMLFEHNGFGELLSEENALGEVTSYKRDILGRVVEKQDAAGLTAFVWSSELSGYGSLESTTSPDGIKTHFAYDTYGRPTTSTWTIDGASYAVTANYDSFGRLAKVDYPEVPGRAPFSTEHVYNAQSYLETIADASTKASFWTAQDRNADGALTLAAHGDGSVETRSYQLLSGRLDVLQTERAGKILDSIKHTYYLTGELKTRTDSAKGRSEVFGYDSLDRLTSWSLTTAAGTRETSYAFDLVGNLEQVFVNSQLAEENTYGQNGRPHALTARKVTGLPVAKYLYDGVGRIEQGGGRAITYTSFDLPKTIHQGGEQTDFSYDAFQQRVRKSKPGSTTVYIADLYERREKEGGIEHVFYVPGEFGPVAEVHYNETKAEEETLYLHGDALSSTRLVMNEEGAEKERLYFEPFGQRIEYDGSPSAQGFTPATEVGFAGHHHDDELGLINMGGRVYDPLIRRFITPDPLVPFPLFGQAYNRYSYGLNNPLVFIDPTGFSAESATTLAGGGEKPRVSARGTANAIKPISPSAKPKATSPTAPTPKRSVSDAMGLQAESGASAQASTPPSATPEPVSEPASSPTPAATPAPAAPAQAAPPKLDLTPEPAPWVGPPPPRSDEESWRYNDAVQGVGGFVAGVALGFVPFGSAVMAAEEAIGNLPPGTRAARIGRALGETVGGIAAMVVGGGASFLGGAVSATGLGAAIGVPAVIVSAELIVGGAANAGVGIAALGQALSTGGGGGPTERHHTIPREIRAPRSGKPSKLPPKVAEHPDIKGRKGNPNVWEIPKALHRSMHPRYNKRFAEELEKLGPKPKVEQVLEIRDNLANEFQIEQYRP